MLKKGKLSYYENNKMNKTGNLLINTSNNIKLINYLKSINIPILEITEEYIKINNENNLNFLYNFLTYNNDVQIINYNFEKNSMEQNLFSELSREE